MTASGMMASMDKAARTLLWSVSVASSPSRLSASVMISGERRSSGWNLDLSGYSPFSNPAKLKATRVEVLIVWNGADAKKTEAAMARPKAANPDVCGRPLIKRCSSSPKSIESSNSD